jgi:hypothetical protein
VELNWDVDFRWATDFSSGCGADAFGEYLDGYLDQYGFLSSLVLYKTPYRVSEMD